MQEPRKRGPGLIGKRWREFAAGDPVGRPLVEWTYITPRYPEGIGVSDLRDASATIQRETALMWFGLNLEPYSLAGGPWFGFGQSYLAQRDDTERVGRPRIAGFGSGFFAPTRLDALPLLREEFAPLVLGAPLLEELAANLPGGWMWRRTPGPPPIDGNARPANWAELSAEILTRLDGLEVALRELRAAPGEIGHNMPPDEFALTPEEEREAEAAIAQARAAVSRGQEEAAAELRATAASFTAIRDKLGVWVLGQLDTFITEANKSVAKRVGTLGVIWLASHHLGDLVALLEHAATLVRH